MEHLTFVNENQTFYQLYSDIKTQNNCVQLIFKLNCSIRIIFEKTTIYYFLINAKLIEIETKYLNINSWILNCLEIKTSNINDVCTEGIFLLLFSKTQSLKFILKP